MASHLALSSRPNSAFTAAAAFLTSANAYTTASGMRSPEMRKKRRDRSVCAPHSRSAGTSIGPKLSFSMRLPLIAAVMLLLLSGLCLFRLVALLPDFLLHLGHVERLGLRNHLIERRPRQCARLLEQAPANSCCSSVFTLANTTPGYASDACSYTGAKPLHGPHHGAQKSTITIGFSLTVFSKFSLVRSIVAIAVLSEKSVQCTLDTHVCRPVRAVSHRAAALRLAGRRARQLARCARGGRTLASAHRGSGLAARTPGRRRPDPARARKPRT